LKCLEASHVKVNFLLLNKPTATFAFSIDYDDSNSLNNKNNDEIAGNSISADDANIRSRVIANHDYDEDYGSEDSRLVATTNKRDPELYQKRNIISALRSKMRRSKPSSISNEEIGDKLKFSPVLSVGEFGFAIVTCIGWH